MEVHTSTLGVAPKKPRRLIRNRTVTRLRWFAVSGQLVVTLFTHFVVGFSVPLVPLLAAIAAAALLNLWVLFRETQTKPLTMRALMGHLAFDALQIGTVLSLTGGIDNPFAVWLILPSMLGAFALDGRRALMIVGLVIVILSAITFWHAPLPWSESGGWSQPEIYELGQWLALVLGVGFTASYARQVAVGHRKLTTALEAAQQVLAREERLTAVGGLAAAAAHELGTPLGTIQVTAREMERELPDGPLKEDAQLLISQTQRCQRILTRLSTVGDTGDLRHSVLTLDEMLREAAKPFLDQNNPKVEFIFDPDSRRAPPDQIQRIPAVIYGLRTLIENAVKFADKTLRVTAHWDAKQLTVVIEDDGPGFPSDVLARLGEPFPRHENRHTVREKEGLGLGFFIAKTLLERSGATLRFGNGRRLRGAWVEISWAVENLSAVPNLSYDRDKEISFA